MDHICINEIQMERLITFFHPDYTVGSGITPDLQ